MKKVLIVLILSCLCQTAISQDHNFGFIAGANFSNLKGDFKDGGLVTGGRIAYNFGVFGEFYLNETVSLSPRLKYSSQGYKSNLILRQSIDDPGTLFETEFRYNYLNIPVIFKFKIINGFRLQAGPQIGYFINGNSRIINSNIDPFDGAVSDFEVSNKLDYGGNLGLAYHVTNKFFVEAIYYQSFTNLTADDTTDIDNQQFYFQINFAYSIL